MIRKVSCWLFALFYTVISFGQSKAYLVQNTWSNALTDYNPTSFYHQLFPLLQQRLRVKDIDKNPLSKKTKLNDEELTKLISEHYSTTKQPAYYLSVSSDLSVPIINLSRFIFKNPTRTSRFVFTINVYNQKGEKVYSDTVVNRGCITKEVKEDKIRNFYDDDDTFNQDMRCHLAAIRKELELK